MDDYFKKRNPGINLWGSGGPSPTTLTKIGITVAILLIVAKENEPKFLESIYAVFLLRKVLICRMF